MKSLGVLLLKSVGAGLGAVNIAGRSSGLRILEFSPLGTQSQLLVLGEQQELQNFIIGLRTADIARSIVLPDIEEKILKSYLGQGNSHYQDFALIFESQFSGDLFRYAVEFSYLGLSIVDFRIQRMSESPGVLIMTGMDSSSVKNLALDLKRENVKITYLSSLSDGFRNYLDVQV